MGRRAGRARELQFGRSRSDRFDCNVIMSCRVIMALTVTVNRLICTLELEQATPNTISYVQRKASTRQRNRKIRVVPG